MISAAIVSYNEAKKLKRCLESIKGFADEIIIVDLGSTDHTKEVLSKFNVRVIDHKHVTHVELVRNFSISQCSGDWILVLDPDEKLDKWLKYFLLNYSKKYTKGVLNIPRKNIFFGEWIKHTNFWPDYQIRFFSRGTVKWKKILHSYPSTTIPAFKLPLDEKYAIRHITYPTFKSFLKKQERYSSIRAQEKYNAGENFSVGSLIYASTREFLSRYIKHRGFMDKKNGILLMTGLIYYFWTVEWKLKSLKK